MIYDQSDYFEKDAFPTLFCFIQNPTAEVNVQNGVHVLHTSRDAVDFKLPIFGKLSN